MDLTAEQRDALKLMLSITESYRTLSIGNAHILNRLARDQFKIDLDIAPTIVAIQSRKGNLIYAEIDRLRATIREIEERST
ncbi:MAG: hypothetical protein P8123_09805 [bacterium]